MMGTMNSAVLGYADGSTGADCPALAALGGFGLTAVEGGALPALRSGGLVARFDITKSAVGRRGERPSPARCVSISLMIVENAQTASARTRPASA